MREIKLRFWDKENNHMIYQNKDSLYPSSLYKIVCDLFTEFEFRLFKKDVISHFNSFEEVVSVKMQYTGLEDRNGKEIYEGDILSFNENIKYKVVHHKSSFKIQRIDFLNGNLYLLEEYPLGDMLIMGNIYENPELLEGK